MKASLSHIYREREREALLGVGSVRLTLKVAKWVSLFIRVILYFKYKMTLEDVADAGMGTMSSKARRH